MSADPRPRWVAVAAVVAGVAVLLGLGTWQMVRRAEKHALIARVEARLQVPPAALPDRIADAAAWDYRRVRVTGRFLHEREIHLSGRVRSGTVGVEVVTPLVRAGGATVLVKRGWVPLDRARPETRPLGQVEGDVTVTGVARVPPEPGLFTPENQPEKGFWMRPDVAEIAAFRGLGPTLPVVVEADGTANPGGWPRGGGTRVILPDNHLQYALTWYALAGALVAIALIARRRNTRKQA